MTRTKRAATRSIAAHYWKQVDILDTFWQKTFIAFVHPLKGMYRDPVSAGAAILSRYLEDSSTVDREIMLIPETFGALRSNADRPRLRPKTIRLAECAQAFHKARKASNELDRLKGINALAFEELQIERIRRKALTSVPKPSSITLKKLIKRKI